MIKEITVKADSRDKAVRLIIERAQTLTAQQIKHLVASLPAKVTPGAMEFRWLTGLTVDEMNLIIKHNVSVAYELTKYAEAKELIGPKVKVVYAPRNQ